MSVYSCAYNSFHHRQVLEVVMSLEKGIAGKELDEDAADAPDVTREGPAQSQDDLWRSIMPGGHDGRMILILEGGRAEIYQANFCVEQDPSLRCLPADCRR